MSNQHSLLSSTLARRTLLKTGLSGVLGLSLSELLTLQAQAAPSRNASAKNVLVVLEQGGMSHMDTWDPKPDAASEHRSPHKPISTNVPGMQFTSLLKKTSQIADKLAVVRSMHHTKSGANGHPKGTQYALSGVHPGSPLEMPDIGSIVSLVHGSECSYLPPYIMVPGNHEQAKESRTGFLPPATRVFKTGGKDVADPDWRVDNLALRNGMTSTRFDQRQKLLSQINGDWQSARAADSMQAAREKAADMLANRKTQAAFDLSQESDKMKEAYGEGHRGLCYLLGRRLIEAGVRFVTVDVRWPRTDKRPKGTNLNWDHHDFIYSKGTCNLPGAGGGGRGRYGIGTWCMMGSVDQAFSTLIRDMDERGLLADTLVCFVTEFGRTPKINKYQGRDHWVNAYSIAFAGAGVPGGQIIGSSDSAGGYVTNQPHTPEDYAATIYEKLGIDRSKPIYTPSNRPVFFGHGGKPIPQLF